MVNTRIYLCDDSLEGIFSAIYIAWSSKYGHSNIRIKEKCEYSKYSNIELFAEYQVADTDPVLAEKVATSIKKKISNEAYQIICRVALSDFTDKSDLIYRFLIYGFSIGKDVLEHLSNPVVNQMFRINKNVSYEAHHFLGFVRFSEKENGLLTSVIHPKNNVLTIIMPHFADRMPQERFLIYDENRKIAALHAPGNPWILAQVPELDLEQFEDMTKKEDDYRDLWNAFFQHIAIKERENYKLQRNNLPLRFRTDMTEFQEKR